MRIPLSLFVCACAFVAACSERAANEIDMTSAQRFEPTRISVSAGKTLIFRNGSGEAHTVTAYEDELPAGAEYFASGGFDSESAARDNVGDGLLTEGEAYRLTLDAPGTYRYFCIPHEQQGMEGTIVVEG